MAADGSAGPPKVVVAGGGPSALEALLMLRERLPADAVRLTLIAPAEAYSYRPLASGAEFATHPPHRLPLADVAAHCRAEFIRERLVLVDEDRRRLLTRDGDWIAFDRLLLATGAAEGPPPGPSRVWPASPEPGALRGIVDAIAAGSMRRIGVVVPAHSGWPLSGFELALILGSVAKATRPVANRAEVELIAEDTRPLALLGETAEAHVAAELERAEVRLRPGVRVAKPPSDSERFGDDLIGRLLHPRPVRPPQSEAGIEALVGGEPTRFDILIGLPSAHGPRIGGVGVDQRGYVLADSYGRTLDSERTWAAGGCTALALKHSALAVGQADVAADSLAAELGAAVDPRPFEPVLIGVLVAGAADRWWAENRSPIEGLEPATRCLWWPPGGVVGGRLAHYIAARDRGARPFLISHPHGTALAIRLSLPSAPDGPDRGSGGRRPRPDPLAEEADAAERRLHSVQRLERAADARLGELERHLGEERLESAEVLRRLNDAGYVVRPSSGHRSPRASGR